MKVTRKFRDFVIAKLEIFFISDDFHVSYFIIPILLLVNCFVTRSHLSDFLIVLFPDAEAVARRKQPADAVSPGSGHYSKRLEFI